MPHWQCMPSAMGLSNADLFVVAAAMTVIAVLPVLLATTRQRAVLALGLSAVPALGGWLVYALSDTDRALGYVETLSTVFTLACLIGVIATALRLWQGRAQLAMPMMVATACLSVFWVTILVNRL
ncbi:MAG: hypothetical protein AAF882_22155 [Pseudomonadota bacterium]